LSFAGDEDEEEGGDEGPAVGGCEEEDFVLDAAGVVPL
jgi:hypothetical protein